MICDNNFIMQTCVALMSLYANKKIETEYVISVIMADCDQSAIECIQQMEKDKFAIGIIETSVGQYQQIKQLAHVPLASLLKFDICNLVSQYDKLLYLDGDIIVRQDLSNLYDTYLGENYVAGVAHSIGILTGEKKLNGGVLLFNARKIREEKLRDVFIQTRQALGDRKSMDQETFHVVFANKKCYLSPNYNVMLDKIDYEKKYYSMQAYNTFYETTYRSRSDVINKAVIIHFTGSLKPWKYTFATCAGEWHQYYKLVFRDKEVIHRKGRIAYLKEIMQRDGIRGIYWMAKDKFLAFLGEYFKIFPDKSHGEWN